MSNRYQDYLEEQLKDPELKAAYDALEVEDTIIRAIIKAQIQLGLTPETLAEKTGISQSELDELENGGADPRVSVLQRLAAGLGMRLRLEFQPLELQTA